MPDQRGFSRFDELEMKSGNARENVLRVIICSGAGDGKSALIGGLVDHLQAEREQGVAMDVADRTFSTDKRSFVVADTPGDEQYTRNMAMGTWIADLAIVLSDARRGVTPETRRHTKILSLLGIRHVILAINKMDLVAWSRTVYEGIVGVYRDYAQRLDLTNVTCIPVSALTGDNVIEPSAVMIWYHGPTLLRALESADVVTDRERAPFRMPVQQVNRPDAGVGGRGHDRVGSRASRRSHPDLSRAKTIERKPHCDC